MKKLAIMLLFMMYFLAACQGSMVTISFDVSGYDVAPIEDIEVRSGKKIEYPEINELFYEFKGWYLDANYVVEATDLVADENMILYGKFEPILSIAVIGELMNESHDNIVDEIERYALVNQRVFIDYMLSTEPLTISDNVLETIHLAINDGAKIIILLSGWRHSQQVYVAQSEYLDIKFVLFGDLPKKHYFWGPSLIEDNTISTRSPQDVSGFLAGYTAVMTGHEQFAFLGNEEHHSIKTGIAFIAGAYYAASLLNSDFEMKEEDYWVLTNTSRIVVNWAARRLFEMGNEVIFTTGSYAEMVLDQAIASNKHVIYDTDVILPMDDTAVAKMVTSRERTVTNLLDDFFKGSFNGGVVIPEHCEIIIDEQKYPMFYNNHYDEMITMLNLQNFTIPYDYDTLIGFLETIDRRDSFHFSRAFMDNMRSIDEFENYR